jgi:hypothetical protein
MNGPLGPGLIKKYPAVAGYLGNWGRFCLKPTKRKTFCKYKWCCSEIKVGSLDLVNLWLFLGWDKDKYLIYHYF